MKKLYYNKNLVPIARRLRNNPTLAEKKLWYSLKGRQVRGFDFHRQKPLGEFIYDFFCYELRLVIEIDGITHTEPEVIANDKKKDLYAESIGFSILRFTDDEVHGCGDKVLNALNDYIENFIADAARQR